MAKTVLLIDDSATVRDHLRAVLEPAGYRVLEASDGREGAQIVADDAAIDLALCDVHMPVMGGLEMVRKVRANPARAGLTIVMLTAESDPKVIEEAKGAGVKGWIVKPVKPELLLAAVKKLIGDPA